MLNSKQLALALSSVPLITLLTACGGSSSSSFDTTDSTNTTNSSTGCVTELHAAYAEFSNVDVVLSDDGCSVTLEADGKPDHTSSYWDSANASGLYVDPVDADLFAAQRSPGDIEDYTNTFIMTAEVNPEKATSTTATSLGPIGIAVSGAPIFNGSEGPTDLSLGVIQGFDANGAHTGPQVYHYHIEPKSISNDDENLVGIMGDSFFIYGRKCYSTDDHPTDLDASGGHTSITQHTGTAESDAEYHYHIQNEAYLSDGYYLVFGGAFQGNSNGFN